MLFICLWLAVYWKGFFLFQSSNIDLRAKLDYEFTLDYVRKTDRAEFASNQGVTKGSITATLEKNCFVHNFSIHVSSVAHFWPEDQCIYLETASSSGWHSNNHPATFICRISLCLSIFLSLSIPSKGCPDDAFNPIANRVAFTFNGLPVSEKSSLKPILSSDSLLISDHMVSELNLEQGDKNTSLCNEMPSLCLFCFWRHQLQQCQ